MPKIFSENGFDFYIYYRDHDPPHVHAYKAGGAAKLEIETGRIISAAGLKKQEAA